MKIIFYPLTEYEFTKLKELIEPLTIEGFEVAFATPNTQLIPLLSISKVVVVNPKTWDYDFTIGMQTLMTLKDKPYVVYSEQELPELYEEIENVFTKSIGCNNCL